MDELKLLAELRRETPPITAAAAWSARARLLAAAASTPASRVWRSRVGSGLARRGWRVAAATVLALVLTVGVTVTRDTDVDSEHLAQGRSLTLLPPVGVANAAELGQRAARVVAGQPDLNQAAPVDLRRGLLGDAKVRHGELRGVSRARDDAILDSDRCQAVRR